MFAHANGYCREQSRESVMIEAVSEIVTMESLSDVVEDIDDEPFELDGSPYLFVPEYTDEELLALENERAEREV